MREIKHGTRWSPREDKTLLSMFKDGERVEDIAFTIGRTDGAVATRLNNLGYSLKGRYPQSVTEKYQKKDHAHPVVKSRMIPEKKKSWIRRIVERLS